MSATKPQRKREPKPLPPIVINDQFWSGRVLVCATTIARIFDVDPRSVLRGEAGMGDLERVQITDAKSRKKEADGKKVRHPVRFTVASVRRKLEGILSESEPQNGLPAPILRLVQRMPVRRTRRQGGGR